MTSMDFSKIVEQICQNLKRLSETSPQSIAACKTGEDFERCVFEATKSTLSNLGIAATVLYTPGSHVFPDIIVEFSRSEKYGIEVKSSTSATSKHWKINGNSVLGSTREDVIDTYIIFGKTAVSNQGFRFRRYEEAIANVAVTHSPRYAIDMEIAPNDTFFAKSGLSYKQISESQDPIGLITSYFKSQGQRAWWLSESTPAAIRMFSDLSSEEKKTLLGYCFAHFPEVFSNSGSKFSRCAMWLAMEHSIVSSSLRDNFSAGGKYEYLEYGRIPKIFNTLTECKQDVISALNDASIEELCEDWGIQCTPDFRKNKLLAWIAAASTRCPPAISVGYNSKDILMSIMCR